MGMRYLAPRCAQHWVAASGAECLWSSRYLPLLSLSLSVQENQLGDPESRHLGTRNDILSWSSALIRGTLPIGGLLASAQTSFVVGSSPPPEVASLAVGNLSWDTPYLLPCNHHPIQGLEDFQNSRRFPSQSVCSHKGDLFSANLGTFLRGERTLKMRLFPCVPCSCSSSGCVAPLWQGFWALACWSLASWCSGVLLSPYWSESLGTMPPACTLLWVQSRWWQSWAPPPSPGPGSGMAVGDAF